MIGSRGWGIGLRVWLAGAVLIGCAPARGSTTGTFQAIGSMTEAREEPKAVLLRDGSVLITGGWQDREGVWISLNSAELFDPNTHSFSPLPAMTRRRLAHAVVAVPDGRVFIMGGLTNPNSDSAAQNAVEVFDPATRTFATAGRLTRPRFGFTATLLPNGRILVVGGGWGSAPAQTAELYDPATGTSQPVGQTLTPRYYGAAVALSDGRVAFVGGEGKEGTAIRGIDIYDPSTNTFTLGGDAVEGRFRPAVASLRDGRILMAGGVPYSRSNEAFGSIEIYDPAVGQSAVAGRMETERSFAQAVSLKDGTILIAGGYRPNEAGEWIVLQTAELFDPVAGTVSTAGPMAGARTAHVAVGLLDGRVLLVGGWNHSTGQLATAEVYVPGK